MQGQGVGRVSGEPGARSGCWRGVRGARCKVRMLVGCPGSKMRGQGVGGVFGEPGVRSGCWRGVQGARSGWVSGEPGARSGRVEHHGVGDPSLQHSLHVQLGGVGLWAARSAERVAISPDPLVGDCNTTQSMHMTRSTLLT